MFSGLSEHLYDLPQGNIDPGQGGFPPSGLVKVNMTNDLYRVFGYKGKQVRDNIHSYDVARFVECFINHPRVGEVYNLGGGRGNACSIIEAFEWVERITGQAMRVEYIDKNREGDHICYISDLSKMKAHYPNWGITKSLDDIFEELVNSWRTRFQVL